MNLLYKIAEKSLDRNQTSCRHNKPGRRKISTCVRSHYCSSLSLFVLCPVSVIAISSLSLFSSGLSPWNSQETYILLQYDVSQ